MVENTEKGEKLNTKLSQNVFNHKILDEFDYEFNRTRTVWVICPWISKNAESNFVYTLTTANVDQLVPNMVLMYVTKILKEFNY